MTRTHIPGHQLFDQSNLTSLNVCTYLNVCKTGVIVSPSVSHQTYRRYSYPKAGLAQGHGPVLINLYQMIQGQTKGTNQREYCECIITEFGNYCEQKSLSKEVCQNVMVTYWESKCLIFQIMVVTSLDVSTKMRHKIFGKT